MEGDPSSTIDSSSDSQKIGSDSGGGDSAEMNASTNASSSGADEESETDELTIDDSCVNDDEMDDDVEEFENGGNTALVTSTTLNPMDDEEGEEFRRQGMLRLQALTSPLLTLSPADDSLGSLPPRGSLLDLVSDSSRSLHDRPPRQESPEFIEHTTIAEDSSEGSMRPPGKIPILMSDLEPAKIDSPEDDETEDSPTSPTGPESPTPSPVNPAKQEKQGTIGSPDATSQQEPAKSIASPDDEERSQEVKGIASPDGASQEVVKGVISPPQSPEPLTSTPASSQAIKSPSEMATGSPITEPITSQENFSQLDTSGVTLSTITSQSSIDKTQQSSQASAKSEQETTTIDEESMDTSQVESASQADTQGSPNMSEMENEESQQSSIVAPTSVKSVSNGTPSKSRSKSRSRSNTVEDAEDVDLEDGEIMDDEEEESKAPAPVSKEPKKEKDKSSSTKTSSKEREKDKERSRDKDKEKERDKEKHRKDKKRSKREEEKEKEKDKDKDKKNKKRKASDADSEQEEYMFVRGASPGSAAPPTADPWSTPVEEFGDDSKVSRAKRRRESDGDNSPHHHQHHHASRPVREPSPPPQARRIIPSDNNRNKRPMREERKDPKSDVICAYFMQGKCQKSAMECSFSHDAVPPRKMELCKFWMMECCAKKEKCLYLHNDFPCKYYHTGLICKAGDRCKFSHSPLSDVTKQVLLKHIETAPKEILGDFPRLNRQGAINLINKMEARMRGEKVDDDRDDYPNMGHNDHHGRGPPIPPHERHHGHGRNDDRHGGRSGRDGHHGGGHGHHIHHGHGPPPRGNNDMRGGPPGRGDDRHHNNNRGGSRWEQHPTRDDQEKLQELMEEAGISGFYKDTLESGGPPGPPPVNQPPPGPPGPFGGMQPGLLPLNPVLMSQMLPGLMPPGTQPNAVNNPALANVLASLNLPNTSIAPPTTLATGLPLNTPLNVPPPTITSQGSEDSNLSSDGKSVPEHLPKMQQELFKRIQMQQQKNEKKMQHMDKPEPEEQEENWYSSEDEDDSSKKKNDSKTEISDKISSVLNQIRQQSSQPQTSSSSLLPPSSMTIAPETSKPPPSFYGDTDFRKQPPSFKDIDLRNPANIFKKIDIEPAKEINASLAHNGPFPWKLRKVLGIPKIDYSTVRIGLPPSSIVLDPRLTPKRNNSIPAPASPTETSSPDVGLQPLTIPDGTPVFDPRTLRAGGQGGGGGGPAGRGSGITPQQNNPFLDSDNRFVSLPNSGINDFPSMFNRDPRGGVGPGSNQGGPGGVPPGSQANLAAMAAAMAAMQQQLPPGMQAPALDPNLLMMGFPFLPQQQPGGNVQNPLDFQQMLAASGGAAGNLRMRPPFPPPQQASSSWERLQGQQGGGGGDVTPPL